MIEKTSSYKTSTGSVHATIQEAQIVELSSLMGDETITDLPKWIVDNRDDVLALLGKKPRKPRAAKVKPTTTNHKRATTAPLTEAA